MKVVKQLFVAYSKNKLDS